MNDNFATKGNLIKNENRLKLAKQGYELLDKKRNVLIKEIMELNKKAEEIQSVMTKTFEQAYESLKDANIENGISNLERLSHGVEIDNSIKIKFRSVMGVEIPVVSREKKNINLPNYGFGNISSALDKAIYNFRKAKDLLIILSMVVNSADRLAISIKKTQRRANALKNFAIPKYEMLVKNIREALEEHERDEFIRLKVIKKKKVS